MMIPAGSSLSSDAAAARLHVAFSLRRRQNEGSRPIQEKEKADEEVHRSRGVRSGTVAARPHPDDPGLDPGGVSGRLVLAGEHQRRADLQARRVQAQGGFLEHRSHDPRHGPPILRFRQWDSERLHPNMRMLCTDPEERNRRCTVLSSSYDLARRSNSSSSRWINSDCWAGVIKLKGSGRSINGEVRLLESALQA